MIDRPFFSIQDIAFLEGRLVTFLAVAYIPWNEAIEIDASAFPGRLCTRWFNPVSNRYSPIPGQVEIRGTRRFAPPGDGDWVLILIRTSK